MALVTKKTSIHRILRDEDYTKPRLPVLEDAVVRTHRIIFHATNLLTLFYLSLPEGKEAPLPDRKFITLATQVVSKLLSKSTTEDTIPNEKVRNSYLPELTRFFETKYLPCMQQEELTSRDKIVRVLEYEAEILETAVLNNIVAQYQKRLYQYINIRMAKDAVIYNIKHHESLTQAQKKTQQAEFMLLLRQIKTDVVAKDPVFIAPVPFHPMILWLRQTFVPPRTFGDLEDDIKKKTRTMKYFPYFRELHRCLDGKFRLLPLRTENVPKNITLDTRTIKRLFKIKVPEKEDSDRGVWSRAFRMFLRVFHKPNHPLHYLLKTDGVSVSLLFKDPNFVEGPDEDSIPRNYVEKTDMTNKTVVAIDPNKEDLLYCVGRPVKDKLTTPVDFNHLQTFRFTKAQKNFETKSRKYRKARQNSLKKTSFYGGEFEYPTIQDVESSLSRTTSKTADPAKFRNYLASKIPISHQLEWYYSKLVHRKRRWKTFINTQKCETKLIKNFRAKYGSPKRVVVCFGNYGQTALKGCESVKGKAYRKLFRNNGYTVKLVDESYTSKMCHCCHGELEKFHHRKSHKPKTLGQQIEVHGLLRCPTCLVNRNHKTSSLEIHRYWNRDLNAAKNIYRIATEILNGGVRPGYLTRGNDNSRGFDDSTSGSLGGVVQIFPQPLRR